MLNKNSLLALLLILMFQSVTQAQYSKKKRFRSTRPYIEELTDYYKQTPEEQENKELLEKINKAWEDGIFSEIQKEYILDCSNLLVAKRAKVPLLESFLNIMLLFKEKKIDDTSVKDWGKGFDWITKKFAIKKAEDFLVFTKELLETNILYTSRSETYYWKSSSNDFRFFFDEDNKYGAAVEFFNIDLVCHHQFNDSIIIYNTSGALYPMENKWVGENGKVAWERALIPADEVNVQLYNYQIKLTSYEFDADSVTLNYPKLLGTTISGSLKERIKPLRKIITENGDTINDIADIRYPQFESFDKKVKIKNIIKDIDFEGRFNLQGRRFVGKSTKTSPAGLIFYKDGKVFMRANANSFTFSPTQTSSEEATVIIYLKQDSIYHTGVNLKYDKSSEEVRLTRDGKGLARRLYTDTYHNLDIDAKLLQWKQGSDTLRLNDLPSAANKTVFFVSRNYFSQQQDNLMVSGKLLHAIKSLTIDENGNTIKQTSTEELASNINQTPAAVRKMLFELSPSGLFNFNSFNNQVTASDKLYEYLQARQGKMDHDNIVIESTHYENKSNAIIDLTTLKMTIEGVNRVSLHDRQGIDIRPKNGMLEVEKNRSFNFDGQVISDRHYVLDNDDFNAIKNERLPRDVIADLEKVKNVYAPDEESFKMELKTKSGRELSDRQYDIVKEYAIGGLCQFYGKRFRFDYDAYNIDLTSIDSMRISLGVTALNGKGDSIMVARPIRSTIEKKSADKSGFSGILEIDKKDNKSGKEFNPLYPIFTLQKEAYVFYDKRSEQYTNPIDSTTHPLYPRNKFYYQISPFVLDSINYLSRQVSIPGKLVSAKIFPDIEENLRVMDDFSLGFWEVLPKAGLDMYQGAGTFYNTLKLSNSGLESKKGELHYITSRCQSKDFVMYPDSTITRKLADKFWINKQTKNIEYPSVSGDSTKVQWYPYKEVLLSTDRVNPQIMYENDSKMLGVLKLTPKLLSGKGYIDYLTGKITSNSFEFKADTYEADSSIFTIWSTGKELAMQTSRIRPQKMVKAIIENDTQDSTSTKKRERRKDRIAEVDTVMVQKDSTEVLVYDHVKANFNFKTNKAEFKTLSFRKVYLEFVKSTYVAFTDKFWWTFNDNTIQVGAVKERTHEDARTLNLYQQDMRVGLTKGYAQFYCYKQDSLNFYSGDAKFNPDSMIIAADLVPRILIADVFILPSQVAEIDDKASMKELNEAVIVANRETKLHTFFDANVKVLGRYEYQANGKYVYNDEFGKAYEIKFANISVDDSMRTVAKGKIAEEEKFMLSPAYSFVGEAELFAPRKNLYFKGKGQLQHECNPLERPWFNFESIIRPDSIVIPLLNEEGYKRDDYRYAGMFLTKRNYQIYPAFATKKLQPGHGNVFATIDTARTVVLTYNSKDAIYTISTEGKYLDALMPGNAVSLNTKTCDVTGKGVFDFGTNLEFLETKLSGTAKHQVLSKETEFDAMLSVDFPFSEEAVAYMGRMMMQATDSTVNMADLRYTQGLTEFLNSKSDVDTLMKEIALTGSWSAMPEKLNKPIFFSDIKFKWDSISTSYKSYGFLGIGNIGTQQINKYCEGFVQVLPLTQGDAIHIYLKGDESTWFFFTYTRGKMQALSSMNSFNNIIYETKEKDRTIETGRGRNYIYEKSSLPIRSRVIRLFSSYEEE